MKKKYIINGILVFLFSAISIYLILDTGKPTYSIGGEVPEISGSTIDVDGNTGSCTVTFYPNDSSKPTYNQTYPGIGYNTSLCTVPMPSPSATSTNPSGFVKWIKNSRDCSSTSSLSWNIGENATASTVNNDYFYACWDSSATSGTCYYRVSDGKFVFTTTSFPTPDYYIYKSNVSQTECENTSGHAILYFPNYSGLLPTIKVKSNGQNYIIGNDVIDETKFKRNNYTLDSWNTKADGTGVTYANGTSYTNNKELILYAQWKSNSASTTYRINYKCGIADNEEVACTMNPLGNSETYSTSAVTITKEATLSGYRFTGWRESKSGKIYCSTCTNKVYTFSDSTTATMTAQWEKQSSTTTDCNKTTFTISGNSSVVKGKSIDLTAKISGDTNISPTYLWTTDNSSIISLSNTNKKIATVKGLKAGETEAKVKITYKPSGSSTTCTKNLSKTITVTSPSESTPTNPTTYKLKYNCNGNDDCTDMPSPNPQTSTTKTFSLKDISIPKRDGYEFVAWMVKNGTVYYHPTCSGVPTDYTCKTTYTILGDYTLVNVYAVWKRIGSDTSEPIPRITEYKIYYDCGEGTNCPETTISDDHIVAIDENVPTRDGYTFTYWTTEVSSYKFCNPKKEHCDEYRIFFNEGYDEITLYANWVANNDPDEGVDNSQTGETAVYIILALGLGMLGYSYYYTKKLKEN